MPGVAVYAKLGQLARPFFVYSQSPGYSQVYQGPGKKHKA